MDSKTEYVTEVVYDAVAAALPTMGRDFTIEIQCEPGENNNMKTNVRVIPLTPLGKAIMPHMKAGIKEALNEAAKEG
jgi:hypothetical protein